MDRRQSTTDVAERLTPVVRRPLAETRLQAIASVVNRHLSRAAQEVIKAGAALLQAKQDVGHGQFERLFQDHQRPVASPIRCTVRYGRMLMDIAKHAVLRKPEHSSVLPSAVSTLHALAQLPAATVQRALISGMIRPEMQAKDVRDLRSPTDRAAASQRAQRDRPVSEASIQREISDTLRGWWQRYPGLRRFLLEEVAAVAERRWAEAEGEDEEAS